MLREFHKEKLQELQLFNMKGKEPDPADTPDSSDPVESVSLDLVLMPGGADDLHQAMPEPEGLLTQDQNRESLTETSPTLPSNALPPPLDRSPPDLPEVFL